MVIYQLLTGRLPWEGATLAELAIRRESERPLPPELLRLRGPRDPVDRGAPVARGRPGASLLDRTRAVGRAPGRRGGTGAARPRRRRDGGDADAFSPSRPGQPAACRPSRRPPPDGRVEPRGHAPPRAPRRGKPKRSAAKRIRAAIGILLVIAILAGVVAGIVLLTTNAGQNTELIKHTIPDQIDQLKQFINDHTQ